MMRRRIIPACATSSTFVKMPRNCRPKMTSSALMTRAMPKENTIEMK